MKKILLISSLIFLKNVSYSQITGNVISQNKESIPFVNILLLEAQDSTVVKGTLANEKGIFVLENVNKGRYILNLNLITYKNWHSKVFNIDNENTQLQFKDIELIEEIISLNEVEISAQKKVIKQNKEGTVVNVKNSILTSGSSALQLLERSPGVVIDQRNNEITLNGKTGVLIMINGKTQQMSSSEIVTLLNGLSGDNIQQIELLTNPSARYDVEGNAGIINIKLIKNDNWGTNGSYSLSGGLSWRGKYNASLNLNHRTEIANFYGSYSYTNNQNHFRWSAEATNQIPVLGGNTDIEFFHNSNIHNISHNSTFGVEKDFKNKASLGIDLIYNSSKDESNIFNLGNYTFVDNSFLHSEINSSNNRRWNNFSSSVFFDKQLNEKSKLFMSTDYIGFSSKNPSRSINNYFDEDENQTNPENEVYVDEIRGESTTNIDIGVLKIDLETEINSKINLETGLKTSFSNTMNTSETEIFDGTNWTFDPRYANSNTIKETIAAAYASFDIKLDSTLNLTVGSRYEYWDRKFSDANLNKDFGKLFPSIYLTKRISDFSSLNLSYNKRITRPNYSDLASSLYYNDPTSVFSGNSFLTASISDNITFRYQYKSNNFSLVYSNEKNPIARFQATENAQSDLIIIAPQNLEYIRSLSLNTFIPIKINNWWSFNVGNNFNLRKFKLSHTQEQAERTYFNLYSYGSQIFTLPKKVSIEMTGNYTSDYYYGSIKVEGYGSLNMGIKKGFNNGGSLQFAVTDVFKTSDRISRYGTITREAYNAKSLVHFKPESSDYRIITLSYTQSFGNNKIKKSSIRKKTSNDEKSRINPENQ